MNDEIPKNLWGELASTITYLRNRSPSRANPEMKTPYECWFKKKPNIEHLRIVWSDAYAHNTGPQQGKLAPRAERLKLVGYSEESKGYRLFDPITKRISISRDVLFDEKKAFEKGASPTIPEDEYIVESILQERGNDNEKEYLVKWFGYARPTWEVEENLVDVEALQVWLDKKIDTPTSIPVALIMMESEPLTRDEALQTDEKDQWQRAIQDEFDSLTKNNTWTLVKDMPPGRKAIGCRWVFKKKLNSDGSVSRYKARLVAKGYSQRYGVDYGETYAPVAKFTSIRTILALSTALDLEIHQMDVKTAFLNGDLEEEIYMDVPEGLSAPPGTKCKLNRTLYGLKQSPRMWHKRLDQYLKSQGFIALISDPSLYKRCNEDKLVIIAVYVDDLLILSNNTTTLQEVKKSLADTFEMSDEGDIDGKTHLGIRVRRDRANRSLTLDQETYTKSILKRFNMEDCNSVVTPLNPGVKLTKRSEDAEQLPVDPNYYQQIVGSLMYLMLGTRPDIAAAVGIVSQFTSDPTREHLKATKHILRYLKGSMDLSLCYDGNNEPNLQGYSDADWGNDPNSRRSISGYIYMLNAGAISWSSKRQPTVALSSTEAEYMALTHATKEAIWLRTLLKELDVSTDEPTTIHEDNQSTIKLAKNPTHHARTKHIDIRHHFIREKLESNEIAISHLSTDLMIADALTKALPRVTFSKHTNKMGLQPLHKLTAGFHHMNPRMPLEGVCCKSQVAVASEHT
jgi:hypothetical protein